jgi:hypothetical protein
MNESDERFAQDARALFVASVDELDGATLSRLNQGRNRALDELRAPHTRWMRWAPAAGAAAAVALAVMVYVPGPEVEVMPATVTDMDILLGEESIEMFEDLEFYALVDMLENDAS